MAATTAVIAAGGLGLPEVLILLALVGVPILLILAVVWVVRRGRGRRQTV
jgi:hypothetical protein